MAFSASRTPMSEDTFGRHRSGRPRSTASGPSSAAARHSPLRSLPSHEALSEHLDDFDIDLFGRTTGTRIVPQGNGGATSRRVGNCGSLRRHPMAPGSRLESQLWPLWATPAPSLLLEMAPFRSHSWRPSSRPSAPRRLLASRDGEQRSSSQRARADAGTRAMSRVDR
jgi:hypothetical protein